MARTDKAATPAADPTVSDPAEPAGIGAVTLGEIDQVTAELVDSPFSIVYPATGTYLSGIPAVPTITLDGVAARLVRTGAFRAEAPEVIDGEPNEITISALEPTDEVLAILDHYDPPDPPAPPDAAETTQPEGPAGDAGPSDSTPEV